MDTKQIGNAVILGLFFNSEFLEKLYSLKTKSAMKR